MVVRRDQVPVVAYCVRRLQLRLYASDSRFVHPYELGANVYCESVHDDEAIEAASRLVQAARSTGLSPSSPTRRSRRQTHADQGGPAASVRPACPLRLASTCRPPCTTSSPEVPGVPDLPRPPIRSEWRGCGPPGTCTPLARIEVGLRSLGSSGPSPERAPHPGVRLPQCTRPTSRPRGHGRVAEDWGASSRRWLAGTVLPPASVRGIVARRLRGRPTR